MKFHKNEWGNQEELKAYRIFNKYGYDFIDTDLLVPRMLMSNNDHISVCTYNWVFNKGDLEEPAGYFRPVGVPLIEFKDLSCVILDLPPLD